MPYSFCQVSWFQPGPGQFLQQPGRAWLVPRDFFIPHHIIARDSGKAVSPKEKGFLLDVNMMEGEAGWHCFQAGRSSWITLVPIQRERLNNSVSILYGRILLPGSVCFLILLLFPVKRSHLNPWPLPNVPPVPPTAGRRGAREQQHAWERLRASTKLGSTLPKPWHQTLLWLWCWKPPDRRCAGWLMVWADPRAKKRERKEEQGAAWLWQHELWQLARHAPDRLCLHLQNMGKIWTATSSSSEELHSLSASFLTRKKSKRPLEGNELLS